MESTFKTLSFDQIIEINRQQIKHFGGLFNSLNNNVANSDTLNFILETLDGEIFGKTLYPSIAEKAAALGWHIISRHVFQDGNKRTGLMACQILLEINGYNLYLTRDDIVDEEVFVILEVAKSRMDLEEFTRWVMRRTGLDLALPEG